MNITLNSEVTAEGSRETYHKTSQSEAVTLDTAVSEAARELADKTVAETREAYERSKVALEAALDTIDRSYDALGKGAAAHSRKCRVLRRDLRSRRAHRHPASSGAALGARFSRHSCKV